MWLALIAITAFVVGSYVRKRGLDAVGDHPYGSVGLLTAQKLSTLGTVINAGAAVCLLSALARLVF